MPEPSYIHLRLRSEYSMSEGILRIKDLCKAALKDRMPSIAISDLGNLFGMIKFFKESTKTGIKPIIGCDVVVENRGRLSRILFLIQDQVGYLKVCDWLTRSYMHNQVQGRAAIKIEWLEESGTKGVIALSGAKSGEIGVALSSGKNDFAEELTEKWRKLFDDRFYLEIQRLGDDSSELLLQRTLAIADRLNIPVVATHPVHFMEKGDFLAHETRVCIANGEVLSDPRRPKYFSDQNYFMTQSDMLSLYSDLPVVLQNTVEIAKRCNFSIELGIPKLPKFPTPSGEPLDDYLIKVSLDGLEKRLNERSEKSEDPSLAREIYMERLSYELRTIAKMKYSGYFLVVADFITWAKSNGVPVGPGRGSGAGSLVAYALEITDLDPLKYKLLFERFLNPERVSMPDFDIDFCQNGRDRVIDYVRRKYGEASVSQISTFGTMAAKAVVRDVARVMEWSYARADQLAKLIPFQPGKQMTLEQAKSEEPRLKELEESDEDTRELLKLAGQLEGLPRNVGMHAGGVLIAPTPLTDYCPLYQAPGSDTVISQFDKYDVEEIGLVKFDFLGLTTLTILDWTIKFAKKIGLKSKFSLEKLPLDDPETYQVFSKGDTAAVFQFESRGMRELLAQAKPDRFEDIIALVALYRPGPMSLIPNYIARKHGEPFDYPDPRTKQILQETYGIMVYQEQVMQMAQIIGGYSLGGADLLRRAMGKKKPEEMAKQRNYFREGASKNGLPKKKADEIFDLMEKFAGYGFNKSHAAAYALVSYQTAYMKAHFLAPFLAANLSLSMDDSDRVEQLINDLRKTSLDLRKPDINTSEYYFLPTDTKTITFGLGAIKGTGAAAIENIVLARGDCPFSDLLDFCKRINRSIVNRRCIESLVRAGAFDTLDSNRAQIFDNVGLAIETAEQISRAAGQAGLFEEQEHDKILRKISESRKWSALDNLKNEKTAFGFYFTGHLFDIFKEEVNSFVNVSLKKVRFDDSPKLVAGIICSIRRINSKRGRMAIVTLDDGEGRLELPIFSDLYDLKSDLLKEDKLVIANVRGERRVREFNGRPAGKVVEELYCLSEARRTFAKRVNLHLDNRLSSKRLKEIIAPYANGSTPLTIIYENNGVSAKLQLGEHWKLKLEDSLFEALSRSMPAKKIEIEYR